MLPVAEIDGLGEQQPRDHPAQPRQVPLVADGSQWEQGVQPTFKQFCLGCQGVLTLDVTIGTI